VEAVSQMLVMAVLRSDKAVVAHGSMEGNGSSLFSTG